MSIYHLKDDIPVHKSSIFIVFTESQEQNQANSGRFLVETDDNGHFLVERKDRDGRQEQKKMNHFEDYNQVLKPSNIGKRQTDRQVI